MLLDRLLKSYFPDVSADLPEKRTIGNKSTAHIEQRKKALGGYLQSLLENRLMHTDRRCVVAIYFFLQGTDEFRRLSRKVDQATVLKIVGYVPPIWAARTIVHKVDNLLSDQSNSSAMQPFVKLFCVTLSDLEEDRNQV